LNLQKETMCAATTVDRLKSAAEKFGVGCGVERDSEGLPVPDDEEEKPTIIPCSDVGLFFGDSFDAGQGTLHVTAK